MIKNIILMMAMIIIVTAVYGQSDSAGYTPSNQVKHSWEAKQAFEAESLFPMFVTGGFHAGLGYRYDKIRLRVSVINGGSYDAEPAGTNNSSPDFKRYYKTSPGLFLGYNIWRNLEAYSFLEFHTFEIEQESSSLKKDIHSTDFGGGISYQFFIGRHIYFQPGFHIYVRGDNHANFNGSDYHIPNVDLSPVVRIGYRIWSQN